MSKVGIWHESSYHNKVIAILVFLVAVIQVGCTTVAVHDDTKEVTEGSGKYLPGKFIWHDLLTSDIEAARNFYGPLFDWSFGHGDRYVEIRRGKQRIGGIARVSQKPGEFHVGRWIASLSVQDIDKAVDLVQQKGGVVHEGPDDIGNRGRVAFVTDPYGAQLALIRAKNGDQADQPIEIGTWLWNELWTNEPEESGSFYAELAGYTSIDPLDDYWLLKTGERWRAGIRYLFERELEERWVPVIRVSSAQETSEMATSLGGRIVIASGDSDEEHVALLADPSGALFMVQEWYGKDAIERKVQ